MRKRGGQPKHEMCGTPTYTSWDSMKQRCRREESYIQRGISVCEEWKDFGNFYNDMGVKPEGTSIDRIDNNKGYYKENCRWATRKEQQNNLSTSVRLSINNETHTLSEWADITGQRRKTLSERYRRGWPHHEVVYGRS